MSTGFDVAARPLAAARALPIPRVATTIVSTATIVASLAPSLLPRTPTTQGIVTGVFAALGFGIAALLRRLPIRSGSENLRAATLLVALLVTSWAVLGATQWQDGLGAAMGMQPIGALYWMQTATVAALVVLTLYGLTAGIGWAVNTLGTAGLTASCLILGVIVVPSIADRQSADYRATSDTVDTAIAHPFSSTRSGSTESYVPWSTLGAEGRTFVTAGSGASARAYVGLASAPDLGARVDLAVRELERTGALTKAAVVVAVPTGSGWIDQNAVRGFERRFHDNVAVVGMQYSYAPSWATFVFGRADAESSARALFSAVARRVAELPAQHRPQLYIYGQSLGSVGGSAAYAETRSETVCGALWAGPPAGTVNERNATVLANSSDPVVRWSSRLLFQPPDLSRTRVDAPQPHWIPVLSYVHTTVDLLGALDAPAGHGHRYGIDQGTRLPACA